jgi:sigma-B regulation protein RsbU (phosphoserine phosphatase)
MRPAREIAGDFYDFFLIDPKRLVIAVGDVCGKGLPASLFAAIAVTVLRTTIREEANLEKAITRANSILCRDNAASLFATLFIGALDLESGRLDYCNCGHNAPMIVSANGVRTLPATGLPLAMMEDHAPVMKQTTLSSAEALVVYSDGITEALNAAGQEFGEDRLAETAQLLDNDATRAAVDRIIEAVDGFAGGCEQSDDITCAVIRRRDPARIG